MRNPFYPPSVHGLAIGLANTRLLMDDPSVQNTTFRPEKHETFSSPQRLYLCEAKRCRRKEHENYEYPETTAHFGRSEEPFSRRLSRVARVARDDCATTPRPAPPWFF